MQPLTRFAAWAVAPLLGMRGVSALTADGRWLEFAMGLACWALMGSLLTLALVLGTRRLVQVEPSRREPRRVYRLATRPTAGLRGVLSWTSTPEVPT